MQSTGKTFEKAIEEVFNFMYHNYPNTSIAHNVFLKSPDGDRQFDVVITIRIPDDEFVTVIEGKDYKSKVSVQKIDEFHSKMCDVNANKGIIVSKMGFSSMAISKAKRFGIVLYSLNDHTTFKEFDLKIPILIEEICPSRIDIFYGIRSEDLIKIPGKKMHFKGKRLLINDQNISDVINQGWADGSLKIILDKEEQETTIPNILPPYYLKYFPHENLNITTEIEIIDAILKVKLQYKYYICDVREVMYNKILKNIDKEKLTFFIDTNSIYKALNNLKPVSREYAKAFSGIQYHIKIKSVPNIELKSVGIDSIKF